MTRKLTQEEFITRVRERYGDKYDLSKAVYVNGKTKVTIGCKIHGDFQINPVAFMHGTECPSCGGTKKSTTEEFVKKAAFVHNGFFTYEHCEYKGSGEKVTITCPYHGDFEQKANNHLNGCNCPKCSEDGRTHKITPLPKVNASTKKLTQEEFIKRVTELYGNKYDFSKTKYVKNGIKVIVTCKEHGDFEITPCHLMHNRGCPLCAGNKQMTTEDFIKKARKVHGDRYNYDKTEYKSTHENIIITCPEHGDFVQAPANHLIGQGCPRCAQSKLEHEIMAYLDGRGIKYETQKTFPWMGRLRLDFYLPNYNVGIECQGIQHFTEDTYYGNKEIMIRDRAKRDLCKANGVKLLYYSNLGMEYPYEVFEDKEQLIVEATKDGNGNK